MGFSDTQTLSYNCVKHRNRSLLINTNAEPALPVECASNGAPTENGGATADCKVSSESHGGLQEEQEDDGGKGSASEATEGNAAMPTETLACATAANSAAPVLEAGKPKEGAEGAPPEVEEAAEGGDDEKSKGLDDENEKLKEMLQKLLASGNDQMGVIAELSDKVRSLERKLAVHKRRRRPKVRVQQRPLKNDHT
ncbi:BAG family molecular chaperone regulator 6-like [Triticum dicoccoides]|uniref:BAG family molecular chaperone regulator 6-like n=1 Tax=Triticum dicoccoides TaxID=85692 RepID=UPI0018900F18|nr:BAG family molecular chaperone regulator 6-like [Triticum dicoccoides]